MRTHTIRYTDPTAKLFDKLLEMGRNSREASKYIRDLEFKNEMKFITV